MFHSGSINRSRALILTFAVGCNGSFLGALYVRAGSCIQDPGQRFVIAKFYFAGADGTLSSIHLGYLARP